MLTGKRMLVRAGLFASLLAVVAIVSGLGVGLTGYLGAATTQGVRAQLGELDGPDLAFQFSLQQAEDPALQDQAVRDVLATALASEGRPIGLQVTRTLGILAGQDFTRPDPASPASGGVSDIVLRSAPDLPDVAQLVEGDWPSTPSEASVQADAAERLGLTVGDTIRIGDPGTDLLISATWRVTNDRDPRWNGDELWLAGTDGTDDAGPLVIDESIWPGLGIVPRVNWTVTPDLSTITAADVAVIATVTEEFGSYLRADDRLQLSSYGNGGRLPLVSRQVLDRLDGLAAVQPLALLVIGAIAVLTLVELARLLSGSRASEVELLWSRGATPGGIAAGTAAEAGLTAVLGAVIGTGCALGVLLLVGGSETVGDVGGAVWLVPVATVAIATIVFGLSGLVAGRRPARREAGVQSGRVRTIAGAGAAVLVAIAAAVATWQLLLYGSPLTPTADGGTQVDPLAVLAPALVLVAVVLLALVAFPRVASLAERAASGRAGVTRVLTARNVGRRPQFAAAPIVLVGLAAAQLVTAAAYDSTWSASYDTAAQLRTGAPLQVQFGRAGASDDNLDTIAAVAGVTASAPVAALSAGAGTSFNTLIAATPFTVTTIANQGLGAFDPSGAAAQLAPERWLPVVEGGGPLVLEYTGDAPATASLRVSDDTGRGLVVDLVPSSQGALEADLPAPPVGAWSVQAIDLSGTPQFALVGMTVAGSNIDLGPWWVSKPMQDNGRFGDTLPSVEAGQGYRGALPELAEDIDDGLFNPSTSGGVRMLPSFDGTADDATAAPVIVSQSLARQSRLSVGDALPITLGGIDAPVLVVTAGIQPGIPGSNSDRALLMDLQRLIALELRESVSPEAPSRVWVATTDAADVIPALRDALPVGTRYESVQTDQSRSILGSAVVALWVAAAGGVALAIIAVIAATGAQLGGRRTEVVVLRAVGVDSRRQAAVRRLELLAVLGYGLAAGVVAGTATTVLTLSALARAAVPRRYASLATVSSVDPLLLAIGLGVLIVLLLVATAAYGRRVAAQARGLSAREVLL